MLNEFDLNKIKIIVFDLDGTLLASDGTIGEESKRLIKELHKHKINFSFATGRLHSAIVNFASILKINTPLISLDGCLIKSYPNGERIFESFVREKYVKKAVKYAEQFLVNIALCHDDAIYFTEQNSAMPWLMDKFGAKYEEVNSFNNLYKSTLEVVLAGDSRESIKYIWERMNFPYSRGLNTSYFKSHTKEGIYYLEIRRKGSSKGKGFQRLLKYLNIKQKEAAVIGDWYNDLTLFQTDAFKVALANAVPEIKRMADLVTSRDNNEDGVAEFLEMVLRSKTNKMKLPGS